MYICEKEINKKYINEKVRQGKSRVRHEKSKKTLEQSRVIQEKSKKRLEQRIFIEIQSIVLNMHDQNIFLIQQL